MKRITDEDFQKIRLAVATKLAELGTAVKTNRAAQKAMRCAYLELKTKREKDGFV